MTHEYARPYYGYYNDTLCVAFFVNGSKGKMWSIKNYNTGNCLLDQYCVSNTVSDRFAYMTALDAIKARIAELQAEAKRLEAEDEKKKLDATTVRPGLYGHWKGTTYRVLHIAKDTESGALMAVYQPVLPTTGSGCYPTQVWVRNVTAFFEMVPLSYDHGTSVQRFTRIGD